MLAALTSADVTLLLSVAKGKATQLACHADVLVRDGWMTRTGTHNRLVGTYALTAQASLVPVVAEIVG